METLLRLGKGSLGRLKVCRLRGSVSRRSCRGRHGRRCRGCRGRIERRSFRGIHGRNCNNLYDKLLVTRTGAVRSIAVFPPPESRKMSIPLTFSRHCGPIKIHYQETTAGFRSICRSSFFHHTYWSKPALGSHTHSKRNVLN